MKVKIHREGQNFLVVLLVILVGACAAVHYLSGTGAAFWTVVTLSALLFGLMVNFFRLPRRHYAGDNSDATVVVSSVDGTVVAVEEVFEPEYLHKQVIQVSVFMNLFNVHANWVPVEGLVTHVEHHAGRFMAANLPKSSTENERSTIVIKTPGGDEILMRQIAGAMARRIVTYVTPGDDIQINDFIGFIKFGSRVDIFLPTDSEVLVKLGDRTWGAETMIARLKRGRQ